MLRVKILLVLWVELDADVITTDEDATCQPLIGPLIATTSGPTQLSSFTLARWLDLCLYAEDWSGRLGPYWTWPSDGPLR